MRMLTHVYWRVSLMACLASVWTLKSRAEYIFVHFKMEQNDQASRSISESAKTVTPGRR